MSEPLPSEINAILQHNIELTKQRDDLRKALSQAIFALRIFSDTRFEYDVKRYIDSLEEIEMAAIDAATPPADSP
jgi:hypothetical protein